MTIDNATDFFNLTTFFELRTDFFKSDKIVRMKSLPEGDTYVMLYLHLLSMAQPNGYIRPAKELGSFEELEEKLADVLKVSKETMDKAVDLYAELGLLEAGDPKITGDKPYVYLIDADKRF